MMFLARPRTGGSVIAIFGFAQQLLNKKATKSNEFLVRAKGIEPSSKAWEAFVLPLYHARKLVYIFYAAVIGLSR